MKKDIVNFITLIIVQTVHSMAVQTHSFSMDDSKPEHGLVDFMSSKVYLPDDNTLPQISILKNTKDDISYILSKLTDEELLNLLNSDPNKSIYDLNDIVQIALEGKTLTNEKLPIPSQVKQLYNNDMGKLTSVDNKKLRLPGLSTSQTAFHKLNHKQILPQNQKNSGNFLALKKLQNIIHTRTRFPEEEKLNEEKKELLFDILVAQLKTLCCKSTDKRLYPQIDHLPSDTIFEKIPIKSLGKSQDSVNNKNNEFIFLILNDEIKNKDNEDLVLVDPDTLENNSSVLILGPVPSPLTDDQLKKVMNRISNELSKPEYASLLQQLSDGTLNDSNTTVMKNFIYGPETRRYIKAHRCNHQSKLAKIYGRPKWLICTGYLNINTPSLYD